ncbi:hypothetical protein ACI65C_013635 [Semiaphis heraclei]
MFVLPCRKTLTNMLTSVAINTGIDPKLIKVLKENVKSLKPQHRFCSILFDEAYYWKHNKEFNGDFYEVEYKFGNSTEHIKIFHLFDPPHLLKGIRNNLLTKNVSFHMDGEKIASWCDIIKLYELDSGVQDVKMLPRLTKEHVMPNEIRKMRVRNAAQVFSQRVSSIMAFLASNNLLGETASDTAKFCLFFDKLFDSVNSSFDKVVDGKIYRAGVNKNSPHHQLWIDSLKVLSAMRFINPTTGNWIKTIKSKHLKYYFKASSTTNPPFFLGFQNIFKSMNEKGIKVLLLRHFNQDSLENFFESDPAIGIPYNMIIYIKPSVVTLIPDILLYCDSFGFGLPLSKHLQKVDIDLKLATRLADETLEEMKCFRNNAENSFKKIYTAAHDLAAQFQVEITMPRVIGRQVHRMNIQAKSTEEYYRISIFNPYMDSYITELEQSNCEDDFSEACLISYQTLFATFNDQLDTVEPESDKQRVADGLLKESSNSNSDLILLESQTKNYIAGFIVKKLNTVFFKNCKVCLKEICSNLNNDHQLIQARDYQPNGKHLLKYPNSRFCSLVQNSCNSVNTGKSSMDSWTMTEV